MKKLKLLIFILSIFLLTGCWNYNELNDLALISGISIDKDEEGFIVNYMISNSSKSESKSNSNETSTILYEGRGSTISKATENINQKLPKIPYLSHVEVIVISEEVAKNDMLKAMDFLLRNPESRKEIYLLVSKDVKAKDTLSILTPLESFPSDNIKSNITSSTNEIATTSTIKYSEFLAELIQRGIDPTLGVIEVEGNIERGQNQESNDNARQDAIIKLTSSAIFKNEKLVYITTQDESTAIDILNKKLQNIYIETECNNEKIVTYITSIDAKTKVKIENNKPKVTIDVKGDGSLIEVNCKVNLEDSKIIEEIQQQVEEKLKTFLYQGINICKKYKTDTFGFGNKIYKVNPKYWKSIEEKWNDELLPQLDVEIKISIDLYSKGSLNQSIKEEIK